MINRSEIGILSPAGNVESLMVAIQGGEKSVYFGVNPLNMWAKSLVRAFYDKK